MTPRKAVDGRTAKYVHNKDAIDAGWPLSSLPESVSTARAYALAACNRRRRDDLRDDVVAAANLALLDAERTFDPALGASWPTHFKRRVWGACRDAILDELQRGLGGSRRETPIDAVDQAGGRKWGLMAVDLAYHDEQLDGVDNRHDAEALIALADERDRATLSLVYLDGLSCSEAAERLGTVKSWVRFVVNRGLETIRERAQR